MQEDPNMRRNVMKDAQGAAFFTILAVHCLAVPHELLHKIPGTLGRSYLGIAAFFGVFFSMPLLMELGYGASEHRFDPVFWIAWRLQFGLLLVHGLAARINPQPRHSRYIGRSWLSLLLPRAGVQTLAVLEVLITFGLMQLIAPYSEPLAVFLLLASAANVVHVSLLRTRDHRKAQATYDALVEGRQFTEDMQRFG